MLWTGFFILNDIVFYFIDMQVHHCDIWWKYIIRKYPLTSTFVLFLLFLLFHWKAKKHTSILRKSPNWKCKMWSSKRTWNYRCLKRFRFAFPKKTFSSYRSCQKHESKVLHKTEGILFFTAWPLVLANQFDKKIFKDD